MKTVTNLPSLAPFLTFRSIFHLTLFSPSMSCVFLLILSLFFAVKTNASMIEKTTNTQVSKEVKAVVYIESPQIGTLLHLRGIAGKGTLISKKMHRKQDDTYCIATRIRFAAGDFNGSSIGIHGTDSIRLNIYSDEVASKLIAGDEVISNYFDITDRSEDKLGDIKIESGLTLSSVFVLNPGEWSWSSLLGMDQKKVDCELMQETQATNIK